MKTIIGCLLTLSLLLAIPAYATATTMDYGNDTPQHEPSAPDRDIYDKRLPYTGTVIRLDVHLYQRMEDNPSQHHTLTIQPVYHISSQLQQQIDDLYREYDLEPPNLVDKGGIQPSEPIAEPTPEQTSQAPDRPDLPAADSVDGNSGSLPPDFHVSLGKLSDQGYDEALDSLTSYLEAEGIDHDIKQTTVYATINFHQLEELAQRDDVAGIYSLHRCPVALPPQDQDYADDSDVPDILPLEAAERVSTNQMQATPDSTARFKPWLLAGGLVGILSIGAYLVIKR